LYDKNLARWLAEIRFGTAHKSGRLAKSSQRSISHLRQSLAQLLDVDWLLRPGPLLI
jgi:hypothetical protein